MRDMWKEELKILFIALMISLAVSMGQWWSAAFIFSYAVLRLLFLIGVEVAKK